MLWAKVVVRAGCGPSYCRVGRAIMCGAAAGSDVMPVSRSRTLMQSRKSKVSSSCQKVSGSCQRLAVHGEG